MKSNNKILVKLGERSYPILIGTKLIGKLDQILNNFIGFTKVVIVSDQIVSKFHLNDLCKSFSKKNVQFKKIILPNGEKVKSFFFLEKLLEKILALNIDRNTLLICLGGGAIGDLVGLCSSLLLRGVKLVQIPTSLLSQVDSSVGGKTAINSKYGKNLLGTFKQPIAVIISVDTLNTLDLRQIKSGYAEILKYSIIEDKSFFLWLKSNGKKVISLNYDSCIYAIKKSCSIKAKIVSNDEKEKGIREILNFGHTFGHAIESITNYSKKINHGEAIYLGMFLALKFSNYLGLCSKNLTNEFVLHMEALELSYKISDYKIGITAEKFLKHLKFDKKIISNKLKFILLKDFGNPTSYILEDEKILLKFLKKELN